VSATGRSQTLGESIPSSTSPAQGDTLPGGPECRPSRAGDCDGGPTQGLRPDGRYTLGYSVSPLRARSREPFLPSIGQPAPLPNPLPDGLDISSSYFNSLSRPKGPNSRPVVRASARTTGPKPHLSYPEGVQEPAVAPLRGCPWGRLVLNRWCRFAQPPATVLQRLRRKEVMPSPTARQCRNQTKVASCVNETGRGGSFGRLKK